MSLFCLSLLFHSDFSYYQYIQVTFMILLNMCLRISINLGLMIPMLLVFHLLPFSAQLQTEAQQEDVGQGLDLGVSEHWTSRI